MVNKYAQASGLIEGAGNLRAQWQWGPNEANACGRYPPIKAMDSDIPTPHLGNLTKATALEVRLTFGWSRRA